LLSAVGYEGWFGKDLFGAGLRITYASGENSDQSWLESPPLFLDGIPNFSTSRVKLELSNFPTSFIELLDAARQD
jgi:hypothetical protein